MKKKLKVNAGMLGVAFLFVGVAITTQVFNKKDIPFSKKSVEEIVIQRKAYLEKNPDLSTIILPANEKLKRENSLSLEHQKLFAEIEHEAIVEEVLSDEYIQEIRRNLNNPDFKPDISKFRGIGKRARVRALEKLSRIE